MNTKKIASLVLITSVLGFSYITPVATAKQYSFTLVQEAEDRMEKKIKTIDLIIKEFDKKLKAFEASTDKDGLMNLSVDDKGKLKFLLHQVIAFR